MKTAKEIYERIRDALLGRNTTLTNFNVGSRIRSLLEAVALAIEEVWFFADRTYHSLFVVTATGEDLDLRARELGITRKPAQKATGFVRFTGQQGTMIPQGTVVSTDPNASEVVEFVTTQDATIGASGTVDVPIEARVAGLQGNVEDNKITYLPSPITGVDAVTNPTATSGGLDEETDEDLRKRCVLKWWSTSYGATENAIRSWALEVPGVADARVIPAWQGPGTVKVLVWSRDADGNLVPASNDTVAQVQALMDARRPITTRITVEQPTGQVVDVKVAIEVATGYDFNTVADAVEQAIRNLLSTLNPDGTLRVAKILAVTMGVSGVENASVQAPSRDLPITGSVIPGKIIVVKLGTYTEVDYAVTY